MSIQTNLSRLTRGRILKILQSIYGKSLGVRAIAMCLAERHMDSGEATTVRHLRYLDEKEYVRLEEIADDDGQALLLASLTSRGLDLLEGSIPADPGIEVD